MFPFINQHATNRTNGNHMVWLHKLSKSINTMNTTIKTIALALGLGLAGTVSAQELSSETAIDHPNFLAKMITFKESNTMKVYVGNVKNESLSFVLKDDKGHTLFSRNISKKEPQAYIRLSMDELPVGIYNVELSDKTASVTKQFKKGDLIVARPSTSLVAINK